MAWRRPMNPEQRRALEEFRRANPVDEPRTSSGNVRPSTAMQSGDALRRQSDRARSINYSQVGNQPPRGANSASSASGETIRRGNLRVVRLPPKTPSGGSGGSGGSGSSGGPTAPDEKRGAVRRATDLARKGARKVGRGVLSPFRLATNPYALAGAAAFAPRDVSESSFLEPGSPRPELMGEFSYDDSSLVGRGNERPMINRALDSAFGAFGYDGPFQNESATYDAMAGSGGPPSPGFSYDQEPDLPGVVRDDAQVVPGNLPVDDEYVPVAQNRLVDWPDLEAAERSGMGRTDPRIYEPSQQFPGAWDSGIEGIGVRRGPSGELEFFDKGGFRNPIRAGENNVFPAEYMMGMGVPDNRDAIRAAAARGDWDALERVGAIGSRRGSGGAMGGGGGGSFSMPDQFAQAQELQERAQRLYQQAARTRPGAARSPIIREADMLASMAERLVASGTSLATTAMGQASEGVAVDPKMQSEILKNMAQAGLYDAQAHAKLVESGRVDPRTISALATAGTEEADTALQNILQGMNRQSVAELFASFGVDVNALQNLTPEMYSALDPSAQGLIQQYAPELVPEESGMFRRGMERLGFAEGGYVDPMMSAMGGYGMEDTLGPMGAMDMASGMSMPGGMGIPDPMQIEYDQYVQGAEQLGLPAIPFEEFVQLKQMSIPQAPDAPGMDQPMGAMGFAAGGVVGGGWNWRNNRTMSNMASRVQQREQASRVQPLNRSAQLPRRGLSREMVMAGNRHMRANNRSGQTLGARSQARGGPNQYAQTQSTNNQNAQPRRGTFSVVSSGNRPQNRQRSGQTFYRGRRDGVMSFSDEPFEGSTLSRFAEGGTVGNAFQSKQSVIAMARGGQVPMGGEMAMAAGGPVPVGGKMVVDPDPTAPTDSIPAVIDGQQPAALDSGEFVIPKHAVMYHGIDKLNKLIAQAEQVPEDGAIA